MLVKASTMVGDNSITEHFIIPDVPTAFDVRSMLAGSVNGYTVGLARARGYSVSLVLDGYFDHAQTRFWVAEPNCGKGALLSSTA